MCLIWFEKFMYDVFTYKLGPWKKFSKRQTIKKKIIVARNVLKNVLKDVLEVSPNFIKREAQVHEAVHKTYTYKKVEIYPLSKNKRLTYSTHIGGSPYQGYKSLNRRGKIHKSCKRMCSSCYNSLLNSGLLQHQPIKTVVIELKTHFKSKLAK